MAINLEDFRFIFHKVGGNNVIFEIANQDNTDSTDMYYGYIAESGAWIIQRSHTIGSTKTYTYAAGKTRTDYDALWTAGTGRFTDSTPALTFDTFDTLGDNL